MSSPAEKLQAQYYSETAQSYDAMHTACKEDEHYQALAFIEMLCSALDLKTVLDVGAGTGRAVRFLLDHGREAQGVEPVMALIKEAERTGIPQGRIVEGNGYHLPFEDNSFDAVIECGILHHVAEPSQVVDEMMRVAKRAVFLSDNNRFGQGGKLGRIVKLALHRLHLWKVLIFLQTKGKMYKVSEGDGIYYSYSVFESYDRLYEWADKIWIIPTGAAKASRSWLHPLLTSSHALVCAIKDKQ
jgi:ubiquinone/menaquinone biosynthesis C-methylase UbiE